MPTPIPGAPAACAAGLTLRTHPINGDCLLEIDGNALEENRADAILAALDFDPDPDDCGAHFLCDNCLDSGAHGEYGDQCATCAADSAECAECRELRGEAVTPPPDPDALARADAAMSAAVAAIAEAERAGTVSTPTAVVDPAHAAAVDARVRQLRADEEARRIIRAETSARIEMPAAFTLDALLSAEIADEPQLIKGLWPAGGNVLCAAQRKAGKTTTVHNLTRSLIDGEPFLDHFPVTGSRRVALFDFELAPSLLRGWLRDQGIRNPGALLVVPMRGRAASLDIRDDRTRARWATVLRDHGAEVLILDPLRPIIDSLGIDEWHGVGPLLQAFDALKEEAGIAEGLIVQHHGHHAERAAGDSRLVGWPDAVWDLTRDDPNDPRSFRYFGAYGRDVDVDKGLVSMYDGHRLAFAAGAAEAKRDRLAEDVAAFISANPGAKSSDIESAGIRGVSKNTVAAILKRAEAAGLVRVEAGPRGAKLAYPAE